jgi:hypothetical protein
MESLLRLACAGALALGVAGACAQDIPPPAPAPVRKSPTSPEAARRVPSPAGNPTGEVTRLPTYAGAQIVAEYEAARAECEVHRQVEQEACLRAVDARYDGALADRNPGGRANPGSDTGSG